MASAMRPAPTKPTRLGPDSAATAAAISPPRPAPPRPAHALSAANGLHRPAPALVHWLPRPHAPPPPAGSTLY